MPNLPFNVARGKIAAYLEEVDSTGPRVGVLLLIDNATFPVEDDDTLSAYVTVAEVLANNQEVTDDDIPPDSGVNGYTRIFYDDYDETAGVWLVITNALNKKEGDIPDPSWSSFGSTVSNHVGKIIIFFDRTVSSDPADWIPLTHHDFSISPDGTVVSAIVTFFWRSRS